MKLDFPPRFSERIGAISLHAVQKIYELDSGKSPEFHGGHRTIRAFDHDELSSIFRDLAIVIPIKNERLRLIEGVLSGIPNEWNYREWPHYEHVQRTIDHFAIERADQAA